MIKRLGWSDGWMASLSSASIATRLVDEIRVGAAGVGIEPVITAVVGQMENTLSPVP
jgi:hypothetical protein